MRPARKGPENVRLPLRGGGCDAASMRPARKGPENWILDDGEELGYLGFNEAGPQGAGKPLSPRSQTSPVAAPLQ